MILSTFCGFLMIYFCLFLKEISSQIFGLLPKVCFVIGFLSFFYILGIIWSDIFPFSWFWFFFPMHCLITIQKLISLYTVFFSILNFITCDFSLLCKSSLYTKMLGNISHVLSSISSIVLGLICAFQVLFEVFFISCTARSSYKLLYICASRFSGSIGSLRRFVLWDLYTDMTMQ